MASFLGGFAGLGSGSIGAASVELVLNNTIYNEQLAASEAKTKASTKSMGGGFSKLQQDIKSSFSAGQVALVGFGAVAALAITKAVGITTEWAGQVRSLQRVTGQSAESASALAGAASILGIEVSKLNTGFGLLEKNIVNNSANLVKYGIATHDATGAVLPFDAVLRAVSDKFATLPKGPEQAAFAMNVFGRSGKDLIPILQQGSAGLAELEKKAKDAGLVMSQDTLDASKNLTRAQHELGDAVKGAAIQLGTSFLPIMTGLAKALVKVVELVQQVPKPLLALGAGFTAVSAGVLLAVKAFTLFKTTTLAFLASPAGLIALALAGIATAFIQIQQNAKAAADEIHSAVGSVAAGVNIAAGAMKNFGDVAASVPENLASIQTQLNQAGIAMTALNFRLGQIDAALKAGKITLFEASNAYQVYGLSAQEAAKRANLFALDSKQSFDDTGKAVRHFADMTKKDLKTWQDETIKTATDTFSTLGTKTKDIFNITQRELARAFDDMLRNAIRFKDDMALLLALKPGTFGISKVDLQQFEVFLTHQAPGYLDAFVNASHAAQERDIREWLRHQNAIEGIGRAVRNLPTSKTIDINIDYHETNPPHGAAVANAIRNQLADTARSNGGKTGLG